MKKIDLHHQIEVRHYEDQDKSGNYKGSRYREIGPFKIGVLIGGSGSAMEDGPSYTYGRFIAAGRFSLRAYPYHKNGIGPSMGIISTAPSQ